MIRVDQLLSSEATMDQEKSWRIWQELNENVLGWILYDGRLYPDKVMALAEQYVNAHSYIDLPFDVVYTPEPVGVFRRTGLEGLSVEGVFYGNGAVARTKTPQGVFTYLWVDPDTVRLFGYPTFAGEAQEDDG